ncbi:MAG: M23 family metallopeptidase [bacterium]|nr:M23 family metallopeptidase [bacterium]
MKMKKKNYSIIIVTGATSTNKEFVISSKLIKNSIIAFFALLLIFGFVIFDYLTVSFDKEKMKRLERENVEKEETISKLTISFNSLEQSLNRMETYKQRIMVAAGLKTPYPLTEVGQGGPGSESPISNVVTGVESQSGKLGEVVPQPKKPTNRQIINRMKGVAQDARDVEKSLQYVETHINEQKAKLASTPALWPTRGYLTDSFGMRTHPFTGKRHFHNGLDIATQLGNKVFAPADGYILITEHTSVLGNLIHIDHGFGFSTRYGHLSTFAVKEGDRVKRGQILGYVGSTGRSTAPHLHYEVIYMGKNQNPMNYIID